MSFQNPDPETLCGMLRNEVKTIAVVGLSPKAHRPSHRIAAGLQREGFRVIPVNPALGGEARGGDGFKGAARSASIPGYVAPLPHPGFAHRVAAPPLVKEVLGEPAYPDLASVPVPVDLVNVFRAAAEVGAIVDECLRLGLKRIWIQQGIVNEAAALRARAGGMTVVMDRCILSDYRAYCA